MIGRLTASARGRLRLLVTTLLVAALLGCGVPLQERPVDLPTGPSAEPAPSPRSGSAPLTLFWVLGDRLQPATRYIEEATVASALALLMQGPDTVERLRGLRTALPPAVVGGEPLRVAPSRAGGVDGVDDVAVIEVSMDFAALAGDDQLLATAQVVWTVTELQVADRVQLTSGGEPLELPTDDGLTAAPVGREDYRSVAPVPRTTSTPPDEVTGPSPGPGSEASG